MLHLAALMALAPALLSADLAVPVGGVPLAAPQGPLVTVQHGAFMLAGRPLPYLHGINYEGPADRPWRMWQDGRFDPALIARDFDAIAAAGYNPVRIFVQHPLPDEILDGDFSRLDTLVALAAARGLRLLITLNDDRDPDLQRVAHVDALVAAHLAGNPAIFGYDLRNEPNLADIAASLYPPGASLPLLSPALVAAYHQRVSMAAARAARRSAAWSDGGFASFDTPTLYHYLNALHLLSAFLHDNPAYPGVPAARYWNRFLNLANRTLAAYLYVQLRAVRTADPTHPVTVGYGSRFWSALPINNALSFRSIHIYPPADFGGFHAALRRFEALDALAPSPLVLEEYGVSNDTSDRQSSAVREMATALYLRTLGAGGDVKWMFDDDAVGYNAYENNLGAVDVRGVPKPTYLASTAADTYWGRTPYRGGLILQPDAVTGAGFVFVARDGLAIGGSRPYADARVRYTPHGPGVVWLDWSTPGVLRVTSTNGGTLTVAMGTLAGASALLTAPTPILPTATATPTMTATAMSTATVPSTVTVVTTPTVTPMLSPMVATTIPTLSATAVTATPALSATTSAVTPAVGLTVSLTLQAGVPQTLAYRSFGAPPPVPIDLPAPYLGTGWYMVARGHNVARPFLAPWLSLAGTAGIGLPLTEAFVYHGMPTQYFDDVALRIGPHGLTTAPIGVVALHGALPRAQRMPQRTARDYDRVTGHNIHGAFLAYWRAHGGLRFWGHPLSEEMVEHGHRVQYFSGAEFVLRPHGAVGLLPLGRRMWPVVRSVYGL
ncbi:MAG TPA: hypothetical protein VKF37_01945 [Chloroflexota bacterium]|nr:hypothetical protein [Chloroflexota bacterium]